ncbi:MAG TPA: VOC family protein [Actinomycetota bacterium]|nr:VOC family protein [Actinomycetota bacterium]
MKRPALDHVSVTVRDIEASLAFYVELLELPLIARGTSDDAELAEIMGQRHVSIRWADIELGEALVLELIEFVQPVGVPVMKSLWDPGATHIGLQVADIDAVHERLREAGVQLVSKPVRLTEHGDWYGVQVHYAIDPDGTWIELVQRPDAVEVIDADQPPTIASTSSA